MRLIDLDGTLVDFWSRYHQVFCRITGITDLSLLEYKRIKQAVCKDSKIAKMFHKNLPDNYFSLKAAMLEDASVLKLDTLWFMPKEINAIFEDKDTFLFTKRRNTENVFWQLETLGLNIARNRVIVVSTSKYDWIKKQNIQDKVYILGDSLQDLEVGKLENTVAIIVGYGLATKVQLEAKNIPFLYCETPKEVLETIQRIPLVQERENAI